MPTPIKDCSCEDFPCCEHADNLPSEPEYCDICGYNHPGDCPDDYEEEEMEYDPGPEVDDQGGMSEIHVGQFNDEEF